MAGIVTAAESIAGGPADPPDGRAPSGPALRRDDSRRPARWWPGCCGSTRAWPPGRRRARPAHRGRRAPLIEWWWADQNARSCRWRWTSTRSPRSSTTTPPPTGTGSQRTARRRWPGRTWTSSAPTSTRSRWPPGPPGGAVHRRRGADILATQVERLVLPGLCGLGLAEVGCTAVLASAHGRVIASTSAPAPRCGAAPRAPGRRVRSTGGPGPRPPRSRGRRRAGGGARVAAVDTVRRSCWMISGPA